MMSITSTTAAIISRPIGIAQPIWLGEEHFQAPLAGLNRTLQKQLVKQMEADGDDLATWQWKPKKLVSAPFSRLRSRRVRRHPIAAAARITARFALVATRSAAARAAASATRTALKHGLIAAPCALLREGSESYKDDAHLTDIYSFPGYQVEIEVPTNPDGS
jgi:hypothetical protein